ncbi:MAG: GGDEF domain-containing protein [Gemmatimonadales bacterium]|nr:GGDEF domain-containing protein [Gemmatimonadales bacterium]
MRIGLEEFKRRVRGVWSPPDAALLDAASGAELLIAKVRLGLTGALLLIPAVNLLIAEPKERATHLTGFLVTFAAVASAIAVYRVARSEVRRPWLPIVTSLLDVTLVTAALIGFSLIGDPHQAVNSKVTFETYFLAIGATCLRYDIRVSILAGLAAMVEYLLVIMVVAGLHDLDSAQYAPWVYGHFMWSDQVSRLILLALQTGLCSGIVFRLQRHRRLSSSDHLTGLFNRAYLEDFIKAEVRRSKRYHRSFAVAMVDIDHFKNFNDQFGHAAGDQVLRSVAHTIQLAVRNSDIVARYGGEEMVVVMPETTLGDARKRIEMVRAAVAAEPMQVPKRDRTARITVSAGLACWPEDGAHIDDLLFAADGRLFQAKAEGRNRVVAGNEGGR